MTPEEAKLLLALPAETAELAVQFGLDEETVKEKLHEFMERGLVIPSKGELRFARDVARLHDATLSSAEKWVDTNCVADVNRCCFLCCTVHDRAIPIKR